MYKINQKVMYLSKKLLFISNIVERNFGDSEKVKYYVLKDINDENVIYLPINSELALKNIRPLLSKKEIDFAIDNSYNHNLVYESSYKERVLKLNELIKENDIVKMLSVIKLLFEKKEELKKQKKQLSNVDVNALQELIMAIESEFSCVLNISKEEVYDYIKKRWSKMSR